MRIADKTVPKHVENDIERERDNGKKQIDRQGM